MIAPFGQPASLQCGLALSVAEVDRERVHAPSVLMWTDPCPAGPDQRTIFATLAAANIENAVAVSDTPRLDQRRANHREVTTEHSPTVVAET